MALTLTQEKLRSLIKEVAGEVVAETFKENTEKGKELREKSGALAPVVSLQEIFQARAASDPSTRKSGDRFFRTLGGVVQGWRASGGGEAADLKQKALDWQKQDSRMKGDAHFEKDLSSVLQTGGAVLIQEELSDDFIEFLRPAIIMSALGARQVPMKSTELVIPAHTVGSTGGWIGEGDPVPVTAPSFGAVEMRLRTYASLVPVPLDLIRYAFINADAFVASDMRLDISTACDAAYLRGSGANGQPQGVRFKGVPTPTTAGTGAPTLDQVTADLLGAYERMGEANLPMQRLGWALSWRTWRFLMSQRTDLGTFAWADEMRQGTLLGAKFKQSASIKNNFDILNTGTADQSEMYLMDMDSVMVGNADGVEIYVSQDGAYETPSGMKSALSRRQVVVRATIKTDIQVRYRDGVQIITGLRYK